MYFLFVLFFLPVFLTFAIFGAYRFWLFILYRDIGKKNLNQGELKEYPFVTIQIPVYNELNVIERIIESAVKIDYPKNKFEIQILDDSDDETKDLIDKLVEKKRAEGNLIYVVRRESRSGFKAGALKNGLKYAKGDFIAIFDADFIIPPDFLKKTLPYFSDPKVAFVQANWDFVNEKENLLTRIQAMLLRTHFLLEQDSKFKKGFFFNFNGTAGIWRKSVIIESGNWQCDTLAEDLDLSLRSYLKGFKGVFLKDLSVLSELPSDLKSFLVQQKRWTKGTFQVALKFWREILRSNLKRDDKLSILIHVFSPLLYILNSFYFLIIWPLSKYSHIIFGLFILFFGLFNLYNIWLIDKKVKINYLLEWRLRDIFYLILIFTFFCFEGSKSVFEATFKRNFIFERTPKKGSGKKFYSTKKNIDKSLLLVFSYSFFAIFISIKLKLYGVIPWFFILALSALLYLKESFNDAFLCKIHRFRLRPN
ncbi:MAG: glycosyltransferase [Candidatus Hydrothermales bacterium]